MTIDLVERTNGYTVMVWDKNQYLINENHEERLEALKVLNNFVQTLLKDEMQALGVNV